MLFSLFVAGIFFSGCCCSLSDLKLTPSDEYFPVDNVTDIDMDAVNLSNIGAPVVSASAPPSVPLSPPAQETTPSTASAQVGREQECLSLQSDAYGLIDAFRASRASEANCSRLTGIDKVDCFDRDSCLSACYGVPNCQYLAYNSNIEFIYDILYYSENLTTLDEELYNLEAYIDEFNAPAAQVSLTTAKTAAVNIQSNPLMATQYSFCQKPLYDFAALNSLQQTLAQMQGCSP